MLPPPTRGRMAKTWLGVAGEAQTAQRVAAWRRAAAPPRRHGHTHHRVTVDVRAPYPGARYDVVVVPVQWMYDTAKAILVYVIAEDVQAWLPRWLWPAGSVVEAAGEAGPVALPRYVARQLRGGGSGGPGYGLRWARNQPPRAAD